MDKPRTSNHVNVSQGFTTSRFRNVGRVGNVACSRYVRQAASKMKALGRSRKAQAGTRIHFRVNGCKSLQWDEMIQDIVR